MTSSKKKRASSSSFSSSSKPSSKLMMILQRLHLPHLLGDQGLELKVENVKEGGKELPIDLEATGSGRWLRRKGGDRRRLANEGTSFFRGEGRSKCEGAVDFGRKCNADFRDGGSSRGRALSIFEIPLNTAER